MNHETKFVLRGCKMEHRKSTCTNVTQLTCGLHWVGKAGGEHSGNTWHTVKKKIKTSQNLLSLIEFKKMKEITECKEKSRIQSYNREDIT